MACGIKSIAGIQKLFDHQTRLLLLQSLVYSHLHYSSGLLSGISQKLIVSLDKQNNWALKTITSRIKYESSRYLQLKFEILPATQFFKYKRTFHMWKTFIGHIPASQKFKYPTFEVTRNKRTNSYFCKLIPKTKYMQNCFFKTMFPYTTQRSKISVIKKNNPA